MEEKEHRCPWCGSPLEKGLLRGGTYCFVRDGTESPLLYGYFKTQIEGEGYVAFFNWKKFPAAYACRSCRKIILPY